MNGYQKLKQEINCLENLVRKLNKDIRTLVTEPESHETGTIKSYVRYELAQEKQIMFGDWFTDNTKYIKGNEIAGFIEVNKEKL